MGMADWLKCLDCTEFDPRYECFPISTEGICTQPDVFSEESVDFAISPCEDGPFVPPVLSFLCGKMSRRDSSGDFSFQSFRVPESEADASSVLIIN